MYLQPRRGALALLVALLVLLLTACKGGPAPAAATAVPPTAAPPPTAPPPPPPTVTAAPRATAGEAANAPASAAPGATEEPSEPAATKSVFDLPGITSYRSRTTVSVLGPAFEDEDFQKLEILGEYIKEPPAQHTVINTGQKENLEAIQIGPKSWVSFGGNWVESSGQSLPDFTSGLTMFDVTDIEKDLGKLNKAGSEKVNGYDTTHYTFDKGTLLKLLDKETSKEDIAKIDVAHGDFYVAREGFVVKWSMHLEGKGVNENKPEAVGAMDLKHELYDFNAKIEIAPPEMPSASDNLGLDLPLPDGATQSFSMEGMAVYAIPGLSVQEATDFFTTTLPEAGFELDKDTSSISDERALLTFKGNGLNLNIMLVPKDDGVEATVSTNKEEG
ncbi:MAG: hypothetical protein M5U01_40370 [Ardenticatenaceae bacterium]|nr:hypothetical protein [Ardenticatenaceae bacterium]